MGRAGKALAFLALGLAAIVNLGLATALLDHAAIDLQAAWTSLWLLAGPGRRLAVAGRVALMGGAVVGATVTGAALLLGSAAAALLGLPRRLLRMLLLAPALTLVLTGLLGALLLVGEGGPIAAALAGFAAATRPLGASWSLAVILLPTACATVEAAARRLDDGGMGALSTLGMAPWRRFVTVALPTVVPAAVRSGVAIFCMAACVLFAAAWPVPARQDAVAGLASGLPLSALMALAFCVAAVFAVITGLLGRDPPS